MRRAEGTPHCYILIASSRSSYALTGELVFVPGFDFDVGEGDGGEGVDEGGGQARVGQQGDVQVL